jgi:hypothetical protein
LDLRKHLSYVKESLYGNNNQKVIFGRKQIIVLKGKSAK